MKAVSSSIVSQEYVSIHGILKLRPYVGVKKDMPDDDDELNHLFP